MGVASTAPGARARTCGTRCNECSSASLDSSGGSGGRKARFRSVRGGEEGRRSDRGECLGVQAGKGKKHREGKASIAGFCDGAFTRGADAHLDVGGGLLFDLRNGLFDLNLRMGRRMARLGRPSRASFFTVPACTANESGKRNRDLEARISHCRTYLLDGLSLGFLASRSSSTHGETNVRVFVGK